MKQRRAIRSPRKVVIRAGIFLLLGAIVNIAVAWGWALWSPQEQWVQARRIQAPSYWPLYLEELGWPPPATAVERGGLGSLTGSVGASVIEISGGDSQATCERSGPESDKTYVSLEVLQFGIPWRSLQWEDHWVRAGPRSMEVVQTAAAAAGWRRGIDVSGNRGRFKGEIRHLPLTPIVPGFAINTLFYAAILWLLFALPLALRRWRRIKRGLCPACAYPVGTSDLCTECGKPVKPRRVESASLP